MSLLGSLVKMAAPAISQQAASAQDPRAGRDQVMGMVFGSAAPQVESFLESKHAGRVMGVTAVALGAFLLPKLLGETK